MSREGKSGPYDIVNKLLAAETRIAALEDEVKRLKSAVEERDRTIGQMGAAFSEVSKYSLSRDLKAAEMKRTLARRTARIYDDLRTENKRLMGALHHVYDTHILTDTPFEEWLEAQARATRKEAGGANATRFAGQCWGGSDTPDERAREEA